MFRAPIFFCLIFLHQIANAQQAFSVEESLPNQTSIPAEVISALSNELDLERAACTQTSLMNALEATKVRIGSKLPTILIKPKPTALCLCGAYACPAWIYQISDRGTKRLWSTEGTMGIEVLRKSTHSYRQIREEIGTAGHGVVTVWAWDGKGYKVISQKSWSNGK